MQREEPSDEALMRAHAAGDEAAFRVLVARYAGRLRALMLRTVPRREDADDLVQETFLQLHRARRDYRPDAPLWPWLVTIALNVRRGYQRRVSRRREVGPAEGGHAPAVDPAAPAALEAEQRARRVRGALSALPDSQREVVELHWFEGLPFAEVARRVGATPAAVRVRAHRAYRRLRELIGGGA